MQIPTHSNLYPKSTKPSKNNRNRMHIFGIGLSRTGTSSLCRALTILKYRCLHFPQGKDINQFVIDRILGKHPTLVLPWLNNIDCLTDTPVCVIYKDLEKAYPNSKFILTIRDHHTWLKSMKALLAKSKNKRGYPQQIDNYLYGTNTFKPNTIKNHYENYVTEAKNYFKKKPQKLLVWNLCENPKWSILCNFLKCEKPHKPFPHKNKSTPN